MKKDEIAVPAELAAQVRKLFPKEPLVGLMAVLRKGISKVKAERKWLAKVQTWRDARLRGD